MPYCQDCGKEIKDGDNFCPQCGANVVPQKREVVAYRRGYRDERKACFGPSGSGSGLWGAMSGGIFVIGLAVLWYFDFWWPGILILIALMAIIGGLVAYTR